MVEADCKEVIWIYPEDKADRIYSCICDLREKEVFLFLQYVFFFLIGELNGNCPFTETKIVRGAGS